jgi:hypothetical protein
MGVTVLPVEVEHRRTLEVQYPTASVQTAASKLALAAKAAAKNPAELSTASVSPAEKEAGKEPSTASATLGLLWQNPVQYKSIDHDFEPYIE